MRNFDLKIIKGRLVIDMDKTTEDYMESYAYDGKPSKYDTGELACTEPFAVIQLSDHQVARIMSEYENGGECGWCGDIKSELREPHLLDYVSGEKICRECWEMDRTNYLGALGEDIGPFDKDGV